MVDADLGAQYRAAKHAVAEHVAVWAEAERARHRWLKAHRGVPAHLMYDRATGVPLDPELAALEQAEEKAQSDWEWCRALVIALGEQIKGRPFEELLDQSRADVLAVMQPGPDDVHVGAEVE